MDNSKKKCKIIMLAVSKADSILPNQLWTHNNGGNTSLYKWTGSKSEVKPDELKGYCIPQHLYILSDEPIKEGDWVINLGAKMVSQIRSKLGIFSEDRKIIATTDISLSLNEGGKIDIGCIALPQPSQQFIEKYITEYNKGNIIEDVLVEYEYKEGLGSATIDNSGNRIGDVLKVDRNNTITISRVKDSWNREEVELLLEFVYQRGREDEVISQRENEYINTLVDYIKENL